MAYRRQTTRFRGYFAPQLCHNDTNASLTQHRRFATHVWPRQQQTIGTGVVGRTFFHNGSVPKYRIVGNKTIPRKRGSNAGMTGISQFQQSLLPLLHLHKFRTTRGLIGRTVCTFCNDFGSHRLHKKKKEEEGKTS